MRNIVLLYIILIILVLCIVFREFIERKYLITLANNIEIKFNNEKIVYIFQFQFFDKLGKICLNGGAERYCTDLTDILLEDDYKPVLIQRGNCNSKKVWTNRIKNLDVFGIPVRSQRAYGKFIKYLKNYEFVIYSGIDSKFKKDKQPNILISHGIVWDSPKNKPRRGIVNDIVNNVNILVSVDTNTLSWFRSRFSNVLQNKSMAMHYIPNYVDVERYKPKENIKKDRIKIIFPRRSCKERGYWLVSKILPKILQEFPNVDFDFVGYIHGEGINNDLKNLMANFPERIKHYFCEAENMVKIYQSADISLIPTLYSEGTSLSCLEAMACGNVVIATNVGGLPNLIINNFNGILINPDEEELFLTLEGILKNEKLRETISKNALNVVKAFDKKIWVNNWKNVINKLKNIHE